MDNQHKHNAEPKNIDAYRHAHNQVDSQFNQQHDDFASRDFGPLAEQVDTRNGEVGHNEERCEVSGHKIRYLISPN